MLKLPTMLEGIDYSQIQIARPDDDSPNTTITVESDDCTALTSATMKLSKVQRHPPGHPT